MNPDFKAPKRHKATKSEWKRIEYAKGGPCRICGLPPPLTTFHHLVSKSLRGDDLPANIVSLCGDGTRGCHGLVEAQNPVACSKLRQRLGPSEIAYVIGKKGQAYLDRRYPQTNKEKASSGFSEPLS